MQGQWLLPAPCALSPWVAPTPWDKEAAATQAAVAHAAGIAVPIMGGHSQDAAELVGEVSVGQDGAGAECWAWWHLLAIPQPGHTDGPWIKAGDAANQKELGWAGRAGEDHGHGLHWWVRVKRWGEPQWGTTCPQCAGGFGVAMPGSGLSHLVSPDQLSHTCTS